MANAAENTQTSEKILPILPYYEKNQRVHSLAINIMGENK